MKTSIWLLAAILSAALFLSTGEASAQGKFIVNQLSGKCIDVAGAPGVKHGTALQLYACEFTGYSPDGAATDQRWEFLPQGFIRNTLSGKCIDVTGTPGVTNGARLILADCELSGRYADGSQTDQQWQILPDGLIKNKLSGKCIDVSGSPGVANGARLQLWECEVAGGPTDQLWRLQ